MTHGFTWRDGERTIRFGRGTIAGAVETLGGEGYALLTTERAAAMAPGVVEGAAGVHMLGDGYVDELAGRAGPELLPEAAAAVVRLRNAWLTSS